MTKKDNNVFGKELEEILTELDLFCKFQKATENEVATKFEFTLHNLKEFDKLQKAINIMKICYHKDMAIGESKEFHFAIEIKKDTKLLNTLDYINEKTEKDTAIIGIDNNGEKVVFDLNRSIHTLIGGATGMGKTNILNNIIYSLTKSNEEPPTIYLIDAKKELAIWDNLPNIAKKTARNSGDALEILRDVRDTMETRFQKFSKQKKQSKPFSQIIVIIDELADLMLSGLKSYIEYEIAHIAQIGRAVNIHLIIATQSPIAKVCTNLIKANCPTIIALKTVSIPTSRVILDNKSAFELQGAGDCIIRNADYPDGKNFKALYLDKEDIINYVKEKKNEHIQKKKNKK